MLHRLGHDSLDHFEAITARDRIVHETDNHPDSEYEIGYQLFETWNEIQPRGMPSPTFGFGYRDQRRDGLRQQTAISHCDACHVESMDRPVDEKTSEIGADLTWAGKTSREIYDYDPDFDRKSSRSRAVIESKADVSYRFNRTLGTLRVLWDYRSIDREYLRVAPGSTKTTSNELGLSWSARPAKRWKTNVVLKFGDASDPFAGLDSQYSTLESPPAGTPSEPQAAQYCEFQDARIAQGTASTWQGHRHGLLSKRRRTSARAKSWGSSRGSWNSSTRP